MLVRRPDHHHRAFSPPIFALRALASPTACSVAPLARSPLVVGMLSTQLGYGLAVVQATGPGPLVAMLLIVLFVPETRGKELEETAALSNGLPPRSVKTSFMRTD